LYLKETAWKPLPAPPTIELMAELSVDCTTCDKI
jgi:hypothetical protein